MARNASGKRKAAAPIDSTSSNAAARGRISLTACGDDRFPNTHQYGGAFRYSIGSALDGIKLPWVLWAVAALVFWNGTAAGFQIDGTTMASTTQGQEPVRQRHLTVPIHEGLTRASLYATTVVVPRCGGEVRHLSLAMENYIVQGAVWNDDPLRYLPHRQHDWLVSYIDGASGRRKVTGGFDHLYQSHFGPLQFLHGMASDGDKRKTAGYIGMWFELVFRIGSGELSHDMTLRSVAKHLNVESRRNFEQLFSRGHPDWSLSYLFLRECASRWGLGVVGRRTKFTCKVPQSVDIKDRLKGIAVGTLLHIVQDTYSASHVARSSSVRSGERSRIYDAGTIRYFHDYTVQDPKCHGWSDLQPIDEPHIDCLQSRRRGCPSENEILTSIARKVRSNADNPIGIGAEVIACVLAAEPSSTEVNRFNQFVDEVVLKRDVNLVSARNSDECRWGEQNR